MDQYPRTSANKIQNAGVLGPRIALFSLFGFKIQLDASWVFLAILIAWSLATAVFPSEAPGLATAAYWWMGVTGALGLFFSLVFHELSHCLVARHYGTPIRGITLFIFGGVAEMTEEPKSAKAELWMALAGPAMSLSLAIIFNMLAIAGDAAGWPVTVLGVANYLARINAVLGVFNLVPAYPLDGGRVFRAALWWWKSDIRWATRQASSAGSAFGLLLILFGLFEVVIGAFVEGMWLFLIGLFLRGAAQASYAQLVTQQALAGTTVAQFMTRNPISVPPGTTIESFVEDYLYRYHHERFPVLGDGRVLGCIGTREIRQVPREAWAGSAIDDIVVPCSDVNTVDADSDATRALALMNQSRNGWLLVTSQGRLAGVITLHDLLSFLAIKLELESSA